MQILTAKTSISLSVQSPAQFTCCNPSIKSSNFRASKDYGKWVNDGTGNSGPRVATAIHHQAKGRAKPRIQKENKFCILHKKLTISKIYGRAMTKIIHTIRKSCCYHGGGAFPSATYLISVSNFHYEVLDCLESNQK